eukprot:scaffold226811_cov30-Tisochrysis_lutea.AAC.2
MTQTTASRIFAKPKLPGIMAAGGGAHGPMRRRCWAYYIPGFGVWAGGAGLLGRISSSCVASSATGKSSCQDRFSWQKNAWMTSTCPHQRTLRPPSLSASHTLFFRARTDDVGP